MHQSGTNSSYKVVNQKPSGSPEIFNGGTKHPEGKHIEKYMSKIAMHKHISN